jgi:non-ribosomal peptide synthetase component F
MPKELFAFPASSGQRRLWFLEQMRPGSPVYNVVPCAVRIGGAIDVAALRQALEAVVSRHETLRTTFARAEGALVQVIAPLASVALPVTDLSARPRAVAEAEVLRLVTEEVLRPFDLARGPLLRATLLRLTDREHVFCLTMHHIVSDGWSVGVLLREVSALYGTFAAGTPAQLPDLPVQFADFSEWERQQLQGQAYKDGVSYWKRQLAGLPLLQLPADRRRPPVQSSRGATQTFELLPGLTDSLRELGRRQGCTLFMTLLAAFQTLLHRYSGQDDIAVGSPIGNRNRLELEGLIGLFLNTLVLRTRLSGDPSFRELLGRVRGTALEAYAHQDVPFEKLVEELEPERNLSHTPLFQVAFVLQNTLEEALHLEGLTVAPLPVSISTGTAKFDLTLSLEETSAGLAGAIEYSTDLFEPATIRRLLGHFQTLLEGLVAYPDRRLSALPLLTADEREQLLARGDCLRAAAPQCLCLHQLFAAQVRRTPEAVAVVFESHLCTYRELDRRANALAHELRRHGVGPEVLVGLCVDRSVEMVVGLLAILKAGGGVPTIGPGIPQGPAGLSVVRRPRTRRPRAKAAGRGPAGIRCPGCSPRYGGGASPGG